MAVSVSSSFTLLISSHKHLVTSYLTLLRVSTQMQGVGVLVNVTLLHSNSHSLGERCRDVRNCCEWSV